MSKVILYMATSINGYIAKENDDTSWISEEEWNSYSQMVRDSGNLIVGHRTYDILTKQPEFSELADAILVVISKEEFKTLSTKHLIAKTPHEALNLLTDFDDIVVAGGGILNSAFMKENLVDEIYVDIEPIAFGKGINLFANEDFETKMDLIGNKTIGKNVIQLHYAVKK